MRSSVEVLPPPLLLLWPPSPACLIVGIVACGCAGEYIGVLRVSLARVRARTRASMHAKGRQQQARAGRGRGFFAVDGEASARTAIPFLAVLAARLRHHVEEGLPRTRARTSAALLYGKRAAPAAEKRTAGSDHPKDGSPLLPARGT